MKHNRFPKVALMLLAGALFAGAFFGVTKLSEGSTRPGRNIAPAARLTVTDPVPVTATWGTPILISDVTSTDWTSGVSDETSYRVTAKTTRVIVTERTLFATVGQGNGQ